MHAAARRPSRARPRSAYGPACSIRGRSTQPPDELRGRRRGGRACSRGCGRRARPRRAARRDAPRRVGLSSWSWLRGGVDRVDEDLDLAAEPRPVALEPDRLLEREQLVQPAPLDVGRDVVGEVRRGRPGPLRVRGREDLVVADRPRGGASVDWNWASVSPQNPTITSVEIAMPGTASRIRVEPLEVVLDRVLAAHPPEDRVVARLDRQVEVLADRRAVGHRLDQPVATGPTGAT